MQSGKPFIWASIFIFCLALTGCYESDTAVLEKGERAPIAGSYNCTNKIIGSKETTTLIEKKDGLIFSSYQYSDQAGKTIFLKKIPSGLFLTQSSKKEGFDYTFIDVLDDKTYLVLVADLMGKEDYIKSLAKKYNIEGKQNGESLSLKGDKNAILDFLSNHDKSVLTVALKCEKQANSTTIEEQNHDSSNSTRQPESTIKIEKPRVAPLPTSKESDRDAKAINVDGCRIKVGSNLVYFTIYQPQITGTSVPAGTAPPEYCSKIPETGQTTLVIDYGRPLRNMTVEFEITKEPEGKMISHENPATHPSGTTRATINFVEQGDYLIHFTLINEGQKISVQSPLEVGIPKPRP
jgi:hypothetical protein